MTSYDLGYKLGMEKKAITGLEIAAMGGIATLLGGMLYKSPIGQWVKRKVTGASPAAVQSPAANNPHPPSISLQDLMKRRIELSRLANLNRQVGNRGGLLWNPNKGWG